MDTHVRRRGGKVVEGPYRLLVTGSRTWKDGAGLWEALDWVREWSWFKGQPMVLVHGDCRVGADKVAATWARERGLPVESHPVDYGAWRGNPAAGLIRNGRMVDLGVDLCVAFICPCTKARCPKPGVHDSHGAADCAHKAVKAGAPVWTIRDGWE